MQTVDKQIQIWRNNTPPPINRPFLHNAFVTLEFNNVSLGGEVRWDIALGQYVFQPGEETSDTTYTLYEVTLASHWYLQLRNIIRDQLGVYVTRGIHDAQCPETPAAVRLQRLLRCKVLSIE